MVRKKKIIIIIIKNNNKKQEGPWATIRSPDKNSYCISVNAMQLLPVLPQQGHIFDHTVKRSKVILVSTDLLKKSKKAVMAAILDFRSEPVKLF